MEEKKCVKCGRIIQKFENYATCIGAFDNGPIKAGDIECESCFGKKLNNQK